MKTSLLASLCLTLCVLGTTVMVQAQAMPSLQPPPMLSTPGALPGSPQPAPEVSVPLQLAENKNLTARLQTMLPPDTDLSQVSRGFTDLRDFVAAIHAANNLNIPFADIRAKMTAAHAMDLKKTIQTLKSDVDAKAETQKATEQAKQDIKESKSKPKKG